jgi:hypothetical protein
MIVNLRDAKVAKIMSLYFPHPSVSVRIPPIAVEGALWLPHLQRITSYGTGAHYAPPFSPIGTLADWPGVNDPSLRDCAPAAAA